MSKPFIPHPSTKLLGVVELPTEVFHALPTHPAQRQTDLHASRLLGSGVMATPLDQHRMVSTTLIGDIPTMLTKFKKDPIAAIKAHGVKDNGHSRDALWFREDQPLPVPAALFCVVHAAVDTMAAVRVYNTSDSLVATKTKRDDMQSALAAVWLKPVSQFIRSATGLTGALDAAVSVLGGSPKLRARHLLEIADDLITLPDTVSRETLGVLGFAPAAALFREALMAIDSMDLPPRSSMPVQATHLGAYISIIHRDPQSGAQFVELVRDSAGVSNNRNMDAVYVVRNVNDRVPAARGRVTAAQRSRHILSVILDAYENWLADPNWTTSALTRANTADKFNPLLKARGDAYVAKRKEQEIARRERSKHGDDPFKGAPAQPGA